MKKASSRTSCDGRSFSKGQVSAGLADELSPVMIEQLSLGMMWQAGSVVYHYGD
ncbi:MAG: hypothetical protein WCL22_03310 [bacterium]